MKLAKRTRQRKFWQCVWVARRWMEIKSLEWELMFVSNPWIDRVEFEEACTDIQIGTGQIPALHKNILLGD